MSAGRNAIQRELLEGLCALQHGEILRDDLLHEQHPQPWQRAQFMQQVLVHAVHPYPAQAGARGQALEQLALAQQAGALGKRRDAGRGRRGAAEGIPLQRQPRCETIEMILVVNHHRGVRWFHSTGTLLPASSKPQKIKKDSCSRFSSKR